jgi:polyhydroxyalkanoate synthesis regulator phasin
MLSKTKIGLASVLVVALLVIGVGASVALAQGPTPTPPRGGWTDLYWQALAGKLGVSVDKLQQAMQDARKDALNEAVKKGLLTQQQADRLLKQPPLFGPLRNKFQNWWRAVGAFGKAAIDGATQALGMKSDDVLAALRGGKTLADLAKEKNVDPNKVKQAIVDAEKAAIDQAVKDGKLTKERAEQLKAKLDPSKIDLSRKHFQPGDFKDKLKDRFGNRGKPPFGFPLGRR